jgi:hypothetical protein
MLRSQAIESQPVTFFFGSLAAKVVPSFVLDNEISMYLHFSWFHFAYGLF